MTENSEMRVRGMLGFAMRAGALVIGSDAVALAMAKGKIRMALIANDASPASKKRIVTKGEFYGIPVREIPVCREELGRLLGKTTTPAAVAVTDARFAEEIDKAAKAL